MRTWGCTLVAAATFFGAVSSAFAAPAASTSAVPPAQPLWHQPEFARGTPKDVVAKKLGMPSLVLPGQIWIYRDFHTQHQDAARRGFDTLLVQFSDNRVLAMRVISSVALDAILEADRRAQAAQVAASSPRPAQ